MIMITVSAGQASLISSIDGPDMIPTTTPVDLLHGQRD